MDIVYFPDKAGKTITFQMFEGKHYPPGYKPSQLRSIRTMELRSDDVYLATFPRTGTHWVFEMTSMLLNRKAETIPKSKMRNQIEVAAMEDLCSLPAPRVLNSHMILSDGPEQLGEKKCKIIFTLRDPKDVSVSMFNLYKAYPKIWEYDGEFEDFLYMFLEGKVDSNGLFGHWRNAATFFNEHPDIAVHIPVYEEMINDTVVAVQNLSDFLGLKRNDVLCQAIAEKCSFSKMKEDKMPYGLKYNDTNNIFRKGIVGDWKNWFTDEMLEDYYRVYEEKMAGSRFYERYAKDI